MRIRKITTTDNTENNKAQNARTAVSRASGNKLSTGSLQLATGSLQLAGSLYLETFSDS